MNDKYKDTREALTRLIFVADEPRFVDVAFVLGNSTINTAGTAIALFKRGLVKKIVISGRGSSARRIPEWQLLLEKALSEGIPEDCVLVEKEARNTRENFLFSEKIISREIGWSNVSAIAIITTPIHSRRALMTARRYFPKTIDIIVLPTEAGECVTADNWWKNHVSRQFVWDEIRRIGEYGAKGDIDDIS